MTILMAILLVFGLTACGSYYRVKDPSTQKSYYTNEIDSEKGGAVKFKDANSGSVVTLQNSEVTEIPKEEFKKNTEKK